MMTTMRSWTALAALLLLVAVTPSAHAEPSEAQRVEASRLAGEALDLFRSSDYETALARFRDAQAVVPTPPLGVMIARCLDKLERLREAADAYRTVIATEIAGDAPAVHRTAREDAVRELAIVLEQTPRLELSVENAGADTKVSIDGTEVESWQQTQSLDPGRHVIEASDGRGSARQEVVLERAAARTLQLRIDESAREPMPATPVDREPETSAWSVAGWTFLAVGGAGAVVWAVAGGVGLSRQSDLDGGCADGRCPSTLQSDVDDFELTKTVSTAGFIGGAIGIGIAIPLLIIGAVSNDETSALRVDPSGVKVTF